MAIKNLGQISSFYSGSTAPTNTSLIWFDTTVGKQKFYNSNTTTWDLIQEDKGFIDDGDFVEVSVNNLSFNNGGSIPSIGEVFILKTSGITYSGNITISINGEVAIELIDAEGNNVNTLTDDTSYMIMKIDDLRDISSSLSYSTIGIDDVYILVGAVSTDKMKIEKEVTLAILDFQTIKIAKYFTIPILAENIKLKSQTTEKFISTLLPSLSMFVSSKTFTLPASVSDQSSLSTSFVFNPSKNNGLREVGDIYIENVNKFSYKNALYTFIQFMTSAFADKSDKGIAILTLSFEYPSKMN